MKIQPLQLKQKNAATVFEKQIQGIGCFSLRLLDIRNDVPLLHDWIKRDYARFWNMQHLSLVELEDFYRKLMSSDHACAYIGDHEGTPAFLAECYDPRHDQLGSHYQVQPGDRGMHLLVAPADRQISGFTFATICIILEFIFRDPTICRVVVEPDIRNHKIHVLTKRAGFRYDRLLALPEKTANLAFCTREQHAAALLHETTS